MADMHYTHDMGQRGYSPRDVTSTSTSSSLKVMANLAGAVTSLALIAGVGVWGYQLVMRDVSGIPVVRATAGEMRIRPADPGGQLAMNTGLAVNEVAAAGEASGPVDRLVLAPKPMDLMDEDQPMVAQKVAPVQQPAPLDVEASIETRQVDVSAALQAGEVEDLVRQLTQGVSPIDAATAQTLPVSVSVAAVTTPKRNTTTVVTGPGPQQSRRPQLRPLTAPSVVIPAAAAAAEPVRDIDPATIPAGTRLVQLGAFDSPEIAREQWDRMQGRFGDYLQGKDRIVQTAESGGRTFYRLRAHGFVDLNEARRFCSALVAEGADCIPVVTR
jgi:hypothetical protein